MHLESTHSEEKSTWNCAWNKSKRIKLQKEDIEVQWQFPRAEPTPQQIKEIQARCAEIGVRFLFKNFSYNFNKESYKQTSGGPRGARVTMRRQGSS